ncbi:MAG: (d)CMP kinase [Planctomycetaceae bacterium]|jgi:cytidylate kinase|nr:(d)CMP kinase [Planctomycetaceae bacterium]
MRILPVITIDGPAGAGKSTVAKRTAQRLSECTGIVFEYLDTGSMYRAVTLLALREHLDWQMPQQLESAAEKAVIRVADARTFLNGEDVTDAVRTPEITEKSRYSADNPVIRRLMVAWQRQIAETFLAAGKGLVTEGRDQGTVVFPDAVCKFYLTASPEERTRRRLGELQQRGITGDFNTGKFDEVYRQITERDKRDSERKTAPLREPEDAHRIVSDTMTADDVAEKMIRLILPLLEGGISDTMTRPTKRYSGKAYQGQNQ